jgi:hypothetical protein
MNIPIITDKYCPICCSDVVYDKKRDCYVCISCMLCGCNRRNYEQEKENQAMMDARDEENDILISKKVTNLPPPYEERYKLDMEKENDRKR